MTVASFRTSGFRDLDRQLLRLSAGVSDDEKRAALHEGGEIIATEARRLAPYLTGLLQESILVVDARDARVYGKVNLPDMSVYVGPVGSTDDGDVYYARFQEFGWRDNPGNPFMRPAIATKRPEAERVIARRLGAAVIGAVR
jgi:HK97 gp10 family phage protein